MTAKSRETVEMLDDFLTLNEGDWKKIKEINRGQSLERVFNAVTGIGLLSVPVTMGLGIGPFADLGFADQSAIDSTLKVVGHSVLLSALYSGIASMTGLFKYNGQSYKALVAAQTQKIRTAKEEDFAAAIDEYIAETNKRLQKGETLQTDDYKILAMFEDRELARLQCKHFDFKRLQDARDAYGADNPRALYMNRTEHGSARKTITKELSATEILGTFAAMSSFTMPLYMLWLSRKEPMVTGEDVIAPRPARPNLRQLAM